MVLNRSTDGLRHFPFADRAALILRVFLSDYTYRIKCGSAKEAKSLLEGST